MNEGAACGLDFMGIGSLFPPPRTLCHAVQSNPNLGDNTVPGDTGRPIMTVQSDAFHCLPLFAKKAKTTKEEK